MLLCEKKIRTGIYRNIQTVYRRISISNPLRVSIKITIERYAHLSPEAIEENRDRVTFDDSNVIGFLKKSRGFHAF